MSALTKKSVLSVCLLVLILAWAGVVQAAPVSPLTYDMYNGSSGTYHYWDKFYTGTGSTTTDGAWLSGGRGDLTDGFIATQSWYLVENSQGTGPYVGWQINPTITFHFAGTVQIDTVHLYVDDADGYGGVNLPGSVRIQMGSYDNTFTISELSGSAPKDLVFSSLGLSGNTLTLTLYRKNQWVFASEVTFDGVSVVPVPASLLLVTTGLLRLALGRQRRV